MSDVIPAPPFPTNSEDLARWQESRRRARMLEGLWAEDLIQAIYDQVGAARAQGWKKKDLSSNPFRVMARELSVLYLDPPHVFAPNGGDAPLDLLAPLWPTMQRFQMMCIGQREQVQRINVDDSGATFRPVRPDWVVAESFLSAPSVPVKYCELRLVTHPETQKEAWAWDVLDISDPQNPIYRVVQDKDGGPKGDDWSEFFGAGEWPDAWRYSDGSAFLPLVLYHAEQRGDRLWDAFDGIESVEGSINLAVGYSMWFHVLMDASWPQRYAVNAEPAGVGVEDGQPRVIVDPAVLLQFVVTDAGAGQPIIDQFDAGADVKILQEALITYAARLASDGGLPASDVNRGASPWSAAAISLTNEGKRDAQKRYAAQFAVGDEELVAKVAAMSNRVRGTNYAEGGYSVRYASIPLSPVELRERRADVLELQAEGLLSQVDGYIRLNPGTTKEEAEQALARIRSERAEAAAGGNVQQAALNGAQVESMVNLAREVASGQIPAEAARQIMQAAFPGVPATTIDRMIASVRGFSPRPLTN